MKNTPKINTTPARVEVAGSTKDTVLDLTFLKLAVHAQQHRSDLIVCDNNGVWVILAGGPENIIAVTRALTPVVEKWRYNESRNREFQYTDTLAEAVTWMEESGNECFHVIMELPAGRKGLDGTIEEGELQVMYAMGVRGEAEMRAALRKAGLTS